MNIVAEILKSGGAAVYLQRNYEVIRQVVADSLASKGFILEPLSKAINRDWVKKLLWTALPERQMKENGAFVYIPSGVKIYVPLTLCFVVSEGSQKVHNIIVVDRGSEVTLTSACSSVNSGTTHEGYTEVFLGYGAKLHYFMTHSWMKETEVVAEKGVIAERDSNYDYLYTCLRSPTTISSTTRAKLEKGASASISTIYVAGSNSKSILSSSIVLAEEGSIGEIVSRIVAGRGSYISLPAEIEARVAGTRGHIECRSLQVAPDAYVETVPVLRSLSGGSQLTHEAAIGKISEEELGYLMSKGFTEEEATTLLVRGFLELGVKKIPEPLKPQVEALMRLLAKKAIG
ncbi:MAG: SufD family Fe-S cluster assembly protein [Thermofilaceae archaeon]